MKNKSFWKKGDAVVRIYGYQSGMFGGDRGMGPGDVATLSEDQTLPGKLDLVEFSGYHDPIRFRRISDYQPFSPSEIVKVYKMVDTQDFEGIMEFVTGIVFY